MKTTITLILSAAALAAGTLLNCSAQAGGLALYEIGTPEVGLASVGHASRVADASIVFRNPGGMGFLDGPQLEAGL